MGDGCQFYEESLCDVAQHLQDNSYTYHHLGRIKELFIVHVSVFLWPPIALDILCYLKNIQIWLSK